MTVILCRVNFPSRFQIHLSGAIAKKGWLDSLNGWTQQNYVQLITATQNDPNIQGFSNVYKDGHDNF